MTKSMAEQNSLMNDEANKIAACDSLSSIKLGMHSDGLEWHVNRQSLQHTHDRFANGKLNLFQKEETLYPPKA